MRLVRFALTYHSIFYHHCYYYNNNYYLHANHSTIATTISGDIKKSSDKPDFERIKRKITKQLVDFNRDHPHKEVNVSEQAGVVDESVSIEIEDTKETDDSTLPTSIKTWYVQQVGPPPPPTPPHHPLLLLMITPLKEISPSHHTNSFQCIYAIYSSTPPARPPNSSRMRTSRE